LTGDDGRGAELDPEARALAARWPRAFSERGTADDLAARWTASRRAARAASRPAFARHPLSRALVDALFEIRRARRLVRGLESAEAALATQAAGIRQSGAASPATPRVSRLLLVSADGSERFDRQVERLAREHADTLEVLVLEAGELELGQAAYGPGNRVRALLVDHKDAVVRLLASLGRFEGMGPEPGPR